MFLDGIKLKGEMILLKLIHSYLSIGRYRNFVDFRVENT